MLTHLPRHRKNDPLWRRRRIRPTPAFSRFPPVHWASVEVRIPTKPATNSNRKPATDSDLKPAGIPI
jgi:hypothetical protein